MAMLWLCLVPVVLAYPTPPLQTADQLAIMRDAKVKAKAASEAATPQVLAFFDWPPFRQMLQQCCPAISSLSALELLQRYRAEAQLAELAHALPASSSSQHVPTADVTIDELGKMSWFPNEFQVTLMSGGNQSRGSQVSDMAMKEIFGCKAFAGSVPTWPEASSRLIYVAHNMRRLDSGSEPHFGDFTVIFNSSQMKDAVIIAPYDTGMYTMNCLHPELHPGAQAGPGPGPGMPSLNCSAWSKDHQVDVPVGTLDHLDHLILPNLWSAINTTVSHETVLDAARVLFSRSGIAQIDYEQLPGIKQSQRNDYFESNILANPPVPQAVKFGIGSFASLFGTDEGSKLQQMALRYQWPLFWAYGEGVQTGPHPPEDQDSQQLNRRMADPSIIKTTNATLNSTAVQQFQAVWKKAEALRASRQVTDDDLSEWWNDLEQQLKVAPISATSCAEPHHCVGLDLAKKDCICVSVQSEIFTV